MVGLVCSGWTQPARDIRVRVPGVGASSWVAGMTADLQRWELRDPMLVVMSRQQAALKRSCEGCAHAKTIETPFIGDTITRCLKGKPYGKRCSRYEVANG